MKHQWVNGCWVILHLFLLSPRKTVQFNFCYVLKRVEFWVWVAPWVLLTFSHVFHISFFTSFWAAFWWKWAVFCVNDSSNVIIVALNKKISIFHLVKNTHIGNQVVSNVEVMCLMKIYTCWNCCIQQFISCRKCHVHLILFQLVLVITAVARKVNKSGVTKRKKGSSSVNRDEESITCLLTKPKGFSSSILTFFFFASVGYSQKVCWFGVSSYMEVTMSDLSQIFELLWPQLKINHKIWNTNNNK